MTLENVVLPEMFSKPWYNEYYRRADSSEAHAEFCRRVYGRDLCQHGMMDMVELDFLVSLISPGSTVLEVGCGNGRITEAIHDGASCAILGIDFSDVAIAQAQARTAANPSTLRFACIDLVEEPIPGSGYDVIVMIDSIYFLGDLEHTLRRLCGKLAGSGRLIISTFQDRPDGEPESVLLPDGTWLAQALRELDLRYEWTDFTENVRDHWLRNYIVAGELREMFAAEGNAFLYEARMAENVGFRESAMEGALVRFLYVVEPRMDDR